ncbi:MAG: dihydrofolate reductase family protein [Solirubrobacteraceae bacterium]
MGAVVVDLSMSLDGFIAGPNDGPGNPLGDGGRRLFDWWTAGTERVGPDDRFKPPARSRSVVTEMFDCGAIIAGRRWFDIAGGWDGHHPAGAPFFVLTHSPPERWVGPGTDGTAVTDGIDSALEQARAVAGARSIAVGGADVAQQYLRAGLLDEIRVNLVPVLLGGGVPLFANLDGRQFDLQCTRVVESDGVTHLRYRVLR